MQVGRINTVSSLGLAKGVGGLPVQVGRTNTVSSLGLAKGVVGLPGTHPVIRIPQDLILNSLCNLTTL